MSKPKPKWASYDTSNFPVVFVKLKNNISNQEDFDQFLNEWLQLYDRKEYFTIHFDATEVGVISPKYCFKMSRFIEKLKKDYPIQYLKESNIEVSNFYIKSLLKLIFFLQEPVCPIYINKKKLINSLTKNEPK